MLEPLPARSIARFLLPLADIMALLFSLFLLLPHLEQHPGQRSADAIEPGSYWSPAEQSQVRDELSRLRRLNQAPVGQRIHLVIFQIEGDGNLSLPQGRESL